MINLIIPLGGKGDRFSKCGYASPKSLVKVLGKEIICWMLDHLDVKNIKTIYIPYHYHLEKYRFEDFLRSKYPTIIFVFLCLNKETSGASESIYQMFDQINKEDRDYPFLCMDGDNFFLCNIFDLFIKSINKNIVFYIEDDSPQECFSFLKINSENKIEEIREKKRISNFVNVGCYGFENGHILYDSCQKMMTNVKYHQKGEPYISGMIQLMIDEGNIFSSIQIPRDQWVCLGTPFHIKMFCNNIPRHQAMNTLINLKIPLYRFCFDLDNTLVTYPKVTGDYTTVEPIYSNISILKYLKRIGHTIIIYTARRMKTHNSNVNKVICDIGRVTFDTLEKYDIPYDELIFGKPYAHFYIDDLAINSFSNLEKELGFYETLISPRDFHNIETSIDTVTKRGSNLKSEIEWYLHMPNEIKDIFPIMFKYDSNGQWYEMEKIYGLTISKLYVEQELTRETLLSILGTLERIHCSNICDGSSNSNIYIYGNYRNKLQSRYSSYDYSKFEDSEIFFDLLDKYLLEYETMDLGVNTIIHGDPVFTNILINPYGKIKMLDVRGKLTMGKNIEQNTLYGDCFYDYAKIYQSLIGYDEILLEKKIDYQYKFNMINTFENYINESFGSERMKWIKYITASLLFTLIPLHTNPDKNIKFYLLFKDIFYQLK
jgi:capsule biosynthesis phosphatase